MSLLEAESLNDSAKRSETQTDNALIRQFLDQDELAFAELVRRHSRLVMSVCGRILHDPGDAEDAFQATFLVLARRASSLESHDCLAGWLHQTARRTALKLRATIRRRRQVEQNAARHQIVFPAGDSESSVALRELGEILDSELAQLPIPFRDVILLTQVEGLSRAEAAEQLGLELSAVRDRLERGRQILRAGLLRRGITLTSAMLATWLAPGSAHAASSAMLVSATSQSAILFAAGYGSTGVSLSVSQLAGTVLKMMGYEKLRHVATWIVSFIAIGGLACGALQDNPKRFETALRGHLLALTPDEPPTLTIALEEYETLLNLDMGRSVKVWTAYEEGQLDDLKTGQMIAIRLASDHRTVEEIHIQGQVREALIQAVDQHGRLIVTSTDDDHGTPRPESVTLAADAILRIGGLPAQPNDLKPGMEVPLEFNSDGALINAIEMEAPEHTVLEGLLEAIEVTERQLMMSCEDNDDGRPKQQMLKLAPHVMITLDGKPTTLAKLPGGSALKIRVCPKDQSVTAIQAESPEGAEDDEDETVGDHDEQTYFECASPANVRNSPIIAAHGAVISDETDIRFPDSPFIIDVTSAPYFAKGDGVTDDTNAIQQALSDTMGLHRMLYFPAGTYLVSRTLLWSKTNSAGQDAWGKNYLQGQNAHRTVIRLKDATFPDPEQPAAIMWCGGFGSADWFHNYVQDITFDVGKDNPGAIGLQFYSNNSGAVRNCRFMAEPGSGSIGLDLGHRDMNGPLLVLNCEVSGFRRGIRTAHAVNGQTLEHLTLQGQSEIGFDNEGQTLSIRDLVSRNSVPAVRTYGSCCLTEAHLEGQPGAEQWPAMINYNGGSVYLRDITTTGYSRALGDVKTPDWFAAAGIKGDDKAGTRGPDVREYSSEKVTQPFPSTRNNTPGSLRLDIQEPPVLPAEDPQLWANVDNFGADPTGNRDSSAAIQKAIDSGATTVFLPGHYALKSTVLIRGNVRRLIGVGGWIDYSREVEPDFRIPDGASPVVCLEHFSTIHGGIEIDTNRTIIFRSVADCDLRFTSNAETGDLYFEDFVTHDLKLKRNRVWARQLNVENEGIHIVNDGGKLWVLGYKTERGGTLLETCNSGHSEILGGFSYTTTAGKLAPMLVTRDASVFTWFNEVCFNGDPFATIIQETRDNSTRTLIRGQGTAMPYVSTGTPE